MVYLVYLLKIVIFYMSAITRGWITSLTRGRGPVARVTGLVHRVSGCDPLRTWPRGFRTKPSSVVGQTSVLPRALAKPQLRVAAVGWWHMTCLLGKKTNSFSFFFASFVDKNMKDILAKIPGIFCIICEKRQESWRIMKNHVSNLAS